MNNVDNGKQSQRSQGLTLDNCVQIDQSAWLKKLDLLHKEQTGAIRLGSVQNMMSSLQTYSGLPTVRQHEIVEIQNKIEQLAKDRFSSVVDQLENWLQSPIQEEDFDDDAVAEIIDTWKEGRQFITVMNNVLSATQIEETRHLFQPATLFKIAAQNFLGKYSNAAGLENNVFLGLVSAVTKDSEIFLSDEDKSLLMDAVKGFQERTVLASLRASDASISSLAKHFNDHADFFVLADGHRKSYQASAYHKQWNEDVLTAFGYGLKFAAKELLKRVDDPNRRTTEFNNFMEDYGHPLLRQVPGDLLLVQEVIYLIKEIEQTISQENP